LIESSRKRILVVQVGKIGDMILTTPLFFGLKKVFPESDIFVLTSKVNNKIALRDKNVSGTIIYKKNIFSVIKLIFTLRKTKFDYWIDTKDEYSSTSKSLLKFGNYNKSIGFNTKENLFDISLKDFVNSEHIVSINLSPILYFDSNVDVSNFKPSIDIPQEIIDKYSKIFLKSDNRKVLINISAGSESRYWKIQKWLELINRASKDKDLFLISDLKDKATADKIMKNYKGEKLNYLHAGNIFEVAEVVRNCDLIISPDTSIVHLASCFNKPIVAMFHNVEWVIKRYAPLSKKHKVILSKAKNSISDISVDDLIEGLKEII
jgi:heptosyltransferase III